MTPSGAVDLFLYKKTEINEREGRRTKIVQTKPQKQSKKRGKKIMVNRYLKMSTAHLKEATIAALEIMDVLYCVIYDEGVFISVLDLDHTDAQTRKKYDELPEDLLTILNYARKLGVSLVWLDRDADEVEGLPVYEW